MSSLRSGPAHRARAQRVPCPSCALAIAAAALLAGGCTHTTSYTAAHDPSIARHPYQVAAEDARKPDLEDDGREAQIPPMKRATPEPDDPREPWSRNYGTASAYGLPAAALPSPAGAPASTWTARTWTGGTWTGGTWTAGTQTVRHVAADRAGLGAIVRGPLPSDLPADFRRRLASADGE